ncbi:hypothetical protein [Azotobacter beijerinckii]|uniref:Metallothionein n=1 Tax=Azotobacter beijerinckii TaxID=170623 RepID=A0A1I1CM27_9GAMM|nr:hypothetical protein [Azotobacter beijerinckii]SFB63547.1 hypothetical protein SAMN04244571_04558 [Azotobacter beijerinckii]
MADTDTHTENEAEVDSCGHEIKDADAIPDEDLPTAFGGVE